MKRVGFRILGQKWKIGRDSDHLPANDLYGSCDSPRRLILVGTHVPPEHVKETILHELIHACAREMTIALSEPQVERLGIALASCDLLHVEGDPADPLWR